MASFKIRGQSLKPAHFLASAALVLATAAAATLAPAASAQLTREAQALRDFGDLLDEASQTPDFVGLAVAVVWDDQIQLLRAYGVREAGGGEPITPDTVFRLASVSKGFAGVLAALEEKEGRFAFTDPVVQTVPQFRLRTPAATASVTIEGILSHQTGLPPFAYDNLLEAGQAPRDILGKYNGVKLTCQPGTCFTYQNTPFNMITDVIEKAAGAAYETTLARRVLDPLGMKTASFGLAGLRATGDWARPHVRRDATWRPTPVKEPYYRVPAAGGMNASITDLAIWLSAQMGSRPDVLPPDVIAEVVSPRTSTPQETRRQKALKFPVSKTEYGLGWRIMDYAGHRLVSHSGGVEGYFAQVAYLPERGRGIVILSNTRGARAGKILPTWLDHELGLPRTDWFQLEELKQAVAAGLPGAEPVSSGAE